MTKKKKAKIHAHRVSSRGLWIAPDLERKIKGEGGRRGLTEPPYSYYLHLADVALRSSGPPPSTRVETAEEDSIPGPEFPIPVHPKPPKLTLPKPPKSPEIPKPAKRAPVKPPPKPARKKLTLPKPPKRGR